MKGTYRVLWFLTCLLLTEQLMNCPLARFHLKTVSAIVGLGLVLAYVNSIFYPHFTLPWYANVVAFAASFFLAGFVMRKSDLLRFVYVVVSVLSMLIAVLLVARGKLGVFDMKDNYFGIPIVSLALVLGCILSCMQIARLLPSGLRATRVLQRIGLLSLPIMFIHSVFLHGPTGPELQRCPRAVVFLLVLGASWALAELIDRYSATRAFFMESDPDFKALTGLEAKT
jgi:fucose 4-O-acetylase-like acetyltransferase